MKSPAAGRGPPAPPLARAEAVSLPVHVIVRDYPETLAIFRRFGVALAERGGEAISTAATDDVEGLIDGLVAATGWRGAVKR